MPTSFFHALGHAVLTRWQTANFSHDAFPDIATAALEARPPSKHVDLQALTRDFLLDDDQPPQTDSPFGEPELVVFTHPRFYIQLLFWTDGTTAIHQHEFSGAFHVLHGSSIHAQYAFENARTITPYLRVGDVVTQSIELLETGRTVPIRSGPHAIHSLFHLDTPSVTAVVRTQHDPGTGPQLNYLPPHVAFDPHYNDALTARRKQLLDVLAQSADPRYPTLVLKMLRALDFERGFSLLHHTGPDLRHLGRFDAALGAFEKKHGSLAAKIAPTLAESDRRSAIRDLRAQVRDPEHRFFLALLMNAPSRPDLLRLVAARHPKQPPIQTVIRWAHDLLEFTDQGIAILDAAFPESVNVPLDHQPDVFLAALEHAMTPAKKLPAALRSLNPGDLKALQAAFAGSALSLLTT